MTRQGVAPLIDALWRIGLRIAYGGLRVWWAVRRPDTHGAYVAVWQDDRLLLIRNSYRRGESVPAGAIGRRETPVAAAVRELREEVGIAVREEELAPAGLHVVPFEGKRDHAHFFELRVDADVAVRVDGREVVHAELVSLDAMDERPLVPHVRVYLRARALAAR